MAPSAVSGRGARRRLIRWSRYDTTEAIAATRYHGR
jgi:hypothetical protein